MLERPIKIGSFTVKNRLAMAPIDLQKADHGVVTDFNVDFIDERTRGGYVGMVIVEHNFVREDGKVSEYQLSNSKEEDVAGLKRLAETIHRNGSIAILQISHAGLKAAVADDGLDGISPSGRQEGEVYEGLRPTHAATQKDLNEITEAFCRAAERVVRAGFDGVEIHSAHGYLLNQFYSPLTNRRTDAYNCRTIEGRVRLQCDITAAVRETIGYYPIVGLRFGACDYQEGGSTVEDGARAAVILEQAGLDFLDVSGGLCGSRPAGWTQVGYFKDASKAVREVVSIPVITAGGIKTREDAESLLEEGAADMIAVARPIIADPQWAAKAME
ncbi:MAG: NADH:flavin oxidoreductase [Clostridia bacterium]|nr:NADH:flavin oxidoreductase [Clostridia bacterium]